MRSSLILRLAMAGSALGAASIDAQVVSGTIVDTTTSTAIDRAFIVLVDDAGAEHGRTLTDSEGHFALQAPAAGLFQLKTERIGIQAHTSEYFQLNAGETHDMEMRVAPISIRLDMIVVEGDAKKCRVREEQGLETATVWEEARKALVNVAWNETNETLKFEIFSFERSYDGDRRMVHENKRTVNRQSVAPFRAPPARELQEYGYVLEDNSITRERGRTYDDTSVYYAPDAEVFFSDPFLDNHCFKLKRDGDDEYEGLVGLEFEPVKGSKVTEVEGTLWLDEETAELRWLDLGYTNMRSHTRERHAEARVDFRQLSNGLWFVREWSIWMPYVEIQIPEVAGMTRREEILWAFKEDGGRVLKVSTPDGQLLYEAPPD
jgi:hypothetical protein